MPLREWAIPRTHVVTRRNALGEGADRMTWIWETAVPISPYNMVIGATEFVVEIVGTAACGRAPLASRADGCIEVTYWVFAPDVENGFPIPRVGPRPRDLHG